MKHMPLCAASTTNLEIGASVIVLRIHRDLDTFGSAVVMRYLAVLTGIEELATNVRHITK
jgi:hypothetical protein